MSKRINIVLPDASIAVLDKVAPKENRSCLISQAVLDYVKNRSAANLREGLEQGALSSAKLNLQIAQDWFPVEQAA